MKEELGKLEDDMENSQAASPRRGDAAKKFFEKGEVLIKTLCFINI